MIRDTLPNRRDVWLAGVLPTGIALLVTAFLMVERLQTDLSLADRFSVPGVWMSFLIGFGLAHIWGATAIAGGTPSVGSKLIRIGKGAVFLVAHMPGLLNYFVFLPGLVLFPLILAFGLDGSTGPDQQSLVFQVLIWPLMAFARVLPGMAFGVLLALAAGPRWCSMSRADWKRLLVAYATSGLVAVLIQQQMSEYVLAYWLRGERNFLFNRDNALPGALIAYAGVILACGCIWMAAFQAYARSGNVLKSRECWFGIASLAAFALPLAATTHFIAANSVIFLGDNVDKTDRFANYVRSGGHTLSPRKLEFHGALFVGPRNVLQSYGLGHEWDRLDLQSSDWKPELGQRNMFGRKIEVSPTIAEDNRPPDCRALSETRTVCTDLARANRNISGSSANITAYAYDASLPEAALIYSLSGPRNAPATVADLQATGGSECLLYMVAVPFDGLTTKAWIGCAAWPSEAQRLKALVSSWFTKASQ
jgi:hypothetical protein